MKILGILLLVVGLIAAVATIAGVGRSADARNPDPVAIVGDQNQPARNQATSLFLPIRRGSTPRRARGNRYVISNPKVVPTRRRRKSRADEGGPEVRLRRAPRTCLTKS
jgi:hypothetical protein